MVFPVRLCSAGAVHKGEAGCFEEHKINNGEKRRNEKMKLKRISSMVLSAAVTAAMLAGSGTGAAVMAESTTESATQSAAGAAGSYTAGTYTGTAAGHNGDITVSVTFTDNAIASVEVTGQSETPTLSDKALTEIPQAIVDNQSLGVDTVSGATFTSRGIINAVADAVDQAGGDSAALADAPAEEKTLPTDDRSTDVLVLGGGTAGLMAAYEAAKQGADVTLVEKLDVLGGTLNEAAGLLLTVNSEKNDSSLDDSLDRVVNFYKSVNSDSSVQPDYDFTSNLMSQTGATVDELIDLGLDHTDVDMGNYVGTIFTAGYQLSADLQKACTEQGVTFITGTRATELVQDNTGAVTGAKVENRSGSYTITAKKTIVACGGASWGDVPEKKTNINVHEKTQIGSTGDGMAMLKAAGAKMPDNPNAPYIKSSQPDFAEAFHNDWSNTPDTGMALMIDASGKRFCNEGAGATIVNKHMIDNNSEGYWDLIDADNAIGYDADYFDKIKELSADGNKTVAVYADTLDELAKTLGIDAGTLKQTVADYNAACKAGKDDAFGKDAAYLKAYPEDGGFYAVYRRVGSWGTIGGAYVNENQQVVDADDQPIANLFAAGESATTQLFGDYYFGGFSLGLYTTAGRIAAAEAVKEIGEGA